MPGCTPTAPGPFILVSHEPGVKTVWKRNPNWWDKPIGNVDEVVFTPIPNAATRVAALLSGEIDWMDPVPLNDQARVNANPGTQVLAGPEIRTIFLGMDQSRDELGHSSVKGKNPFKDVRVRKAFYQAIDEDAINKKVMRGQATPSALMIAPSLFSLSKDFKRFPFDPEASKKLLAEAGYPDGFEVQMDCPNDRYVNDEQICQAVVGMLARVGVKVDLNAEPKSKFFASISAAGGYDSSFYLLGWTPTTLESFNVFQYIMGCRDPKTNWGGNNVGGYCNPKVDALARKALEEPDEEKRDDIFAQAWRIVALRRRRLLPAAPAGAGLGRVEDDACGSAAGQLLHLLLGDEGLIGEPPRMAWPVATAVAAPGLEASPMIAFILRRLAASIGVLIAVGLIAFAMFRYVGDPVNQMVGIETSVAERAQLRQQLGLERARDRPGASRFLANAARFDFGVSYQFKQPVADLIGARMPATLELAFVGVDPVARGRHPDGRLCRLASRQRARQAVPGAVARSASRCRPSSPESC